MRVVQTVKIAQIDHGKRLPLNPKVLLFAVEMQFRNVIFPPVNLERIPGGKYKLKGGRHRLAAHKLLGKTEIRASVAIKEEPYPYKPFVSSGE